MARMQKYRKKIPKHKKHQHKFPNSGICPNCQQRITKEEGGHFCPPFGGESGFFICKPKGACFGSY